MGACATKFNVSMDAGDAPVPNPKEDEGKKDIQPLVAADDEAKRQSLGRMFKENESVENDGKVSGHVKQEDAPPESLEVVADEKDETGKAPTADSQNLESSEEKETEVVKSESCVEAEESQKIMRENPVEIPKLETSEKVEDNLAVVKSENCVEAEVSQKIIEEKPVEIPKLETSEKVEDNLAVVKSESCIEAEESQKKPVEILKLETFKKVEDKLAVEHLKTEEPEEKKMDEKSVIDKKIDTHEAKKTEEQKPTSDAENSNA